MSVVIGTAEDYFTAVGGYCGKNLGTTSNGVLWAIWSDGTETTTTSVQLRYSTNNGTTWTNPGAGSFFGWSGTANNKSPRISFFIDQDDYAHVVYKDHNDGYIYYRRGTPNAGRTAWTWTAAYVIDNATVWVDYPDCVAHREGTGWKVHVTWSSDVNSSTDHCAYARLNITSSGTITTDVAHQTIGLGTYGIDSYKVSSIDFHHNGDGKTLSGNPDLYLVMNTCTSGVAGAGVLFFKATYSAGTWTWGPAREIDNSLKLNSLGQFQQLIFDGTRVIFGGYYAGATTTMAVWSRDPEDTTTTTLLYQTNAISGQNASANYGGMTVDGAGNIYIAGTQSATNPTGVVRLVYYQLDPTKQTLPPPVEVYRPPGGSPDLYPKFQRFRPSPDGLAMLYPNDGAAPVNINFAAYNILTRRTINTAIERDYVPAGPPTLLPVNTVIESDTAIAMGGSRYRYRLESPTFPVAVNHGGARYHLDQSVSIVRIGGQLRAVNTPTPEQLQAAGTEGIDWFIGGHIYDNLPYQVVRELSANGFATIAPGYGVGGYGNNPYGG